MEREILSKAAAWFARETDSIAYRAFEFVRANQARYPIAMYVPRAGRLPQRLLRVAGAAAEPAGERERGVEPSDHGGPRRVVEYLRSFGLFGLWQLWQSS